MINPMLLGLTAFALLSLNTILFADTLADRKRVVVFLGAPGSGKGTQAKRLATELNIPQISTGDLFRAHMSRNSDLGLKVKSYIDKGELVPDQLVLDMLFAHVSDLNNQKGFILDGFPRTIAQAEALSQRLGKETKVQVVNLEVNDEAIVDRITGRRTCQSCGHVYNLYFSPPAKENVCDKCRGKLTQRGDDTVQVVQERLRVYHSQTAPLAEYYRKKGILVNVDGEGDQNEIFEQIKKALKIT